MHLDGDHLSSKNTLSKKIEYLRTRLNAIVSISKNLTSPEIIELSQELDRILNAYNNLINI